ncbi:late embryogenesis abundant protein At5g17165-like [Durio zibethinus]|uniref:Late embryogenesis abundant protein At5g17165-like n=1 Tax=Durio zibethinus TaxID=66656 RepID=A0A6P5WWJ2_DURZI|nr:late embryogenesis abundant protein At5g17165-like [Durio zibethinus]
MAANWKSGGGIAVLGKRLLNRTSIRQPSPFNDFATHSPPAVALTIRSAHASAYDKNLDDQVHSSVVPDDVIQPQSDKYWAPHPKTGVFGPATELDASAGGEQGFRSSLANGGVNSVLEEKAWFRPTSIEDLEKPHHH